MSLAAPLFLIAALAGLLPLIVHLIHRQRAPELPFSTLRFLRLSVQQTRRRRQVHDVLLLVIRSLVLVLIALGLAKPAITSVRSIFGAGTTSAVVVVLDNSASMGLVDQGRPRFETAVGVAEAILDQLHEGDAAALLLTGGPSLGQDARLYKTQETVRQMLSAARPSYERADFPAQLLQARTLLERADAPNKEIYVVTDGQALSWANSNDGKQPERSADAPPVVLVDVGRQPTPNVALRNVELQAPVLAAGLPVQVGVELFNAAPVSQEDHVELYLDGSRVQASPTLSIPAGQNVRHTFPFTVARSGVHRGEVRLAGDDGSHLDNRLFFGFVVSEQIRVAIVQPRRHEIPYLEDGFYLQRALVPAEGESWGIQLTSLTPEQLADAKLGSYAVVFCVNLPELETAIARRLRDYTLAGGHVIWTCGNNVRPDAYNRMNRLLDDQVLPVALAEPRKPADGNDSWRIGFLDGEHPALGSLTEPESLYQSVLVYQHVRLNPPSAQAGQGGDAKSTGGARVLARLDDGEPLLVQRNVGRGSVFLLGTDVHGDWTNLPLRPIFLPLFAQLTFHLAQAEATRSQLLAGAPLVVPLESAATATPVEIVRPSGEVQRITPEGPTLRYGETHDVGIYLVRQDGSGPHAHVFSVNIDPDEADPARLSREQLKARLAPQPVLFCSGEEELADTIQRLRQGRSLRELLLYAVLLGLVSEVFLANRRGRRGQSPPPPFEGRRRIATAGLG